MTCQNNGLLTIQEDGTAEDIQDLQYFSSLPVFHNLQAVLFIKILTIFMNILKFLFISIF